MSKKYFETKEFKDLNKDWEKKLKKSGFDDIETKHDKETGYVHKQEFKVEHSYVVYFEKCGTYLRSGKVKDAIDAFILEKHCEGVSNHEISNQLRQYKFRPLTHQAVALRLIKILSVAGIEPVSFRF
jgi:hypothetical protein